MKERNAHHIQIMNSTNSNKHALYEKLMQEAVKILQTGSGPQSNILLYTHIVLVNITHQRDCFLTLYIMLVVSKHRA